MATEILRPDERSNLELRTQRVTKAMAADIASGHAPILLVVDLQHVMVEGYPPWGPRSTPTLEENVRLLLMVWRSKSWPVVHVLHHDLSADPNNILNPEHPEEFASHECSRPEVGEKCVIKHVGSPFVATDLAEVLEEMGENRKMVVIGMDGAQCINSTVRHASDMGYEIIVPGDACASYGMPHWKIAGRAMSAEEVNDAAMSMLGDYATVILTSGVFDALKE